MLTSRAKQIRHGLSSVFFLLLLSLLSGCATTGAGPEVSTPPLTPSELADKIHQDLGVVATAVDQYRSRFGEVPPTTGEFLESGIIAAMPSYPQELGRGGYEIRARYDDMDGVGEHDDTIYTGDRVPTDVCREYSLRYATPPLNITDIFDYQAAGNKYPGEVHGRQIVTYAIKWQTIEDFCEINRVIRYND
ncbi:MAG: hypothetical protein RQ723_10565 [Desulfuromonadales bacterium]|nr:hypothetical protein [Desulfuromonadales bacterium]